MWAEGVPPQAAALRRPRSARLRAPAGLLLVLGSLLLAASTSFTPGPHAPARVARPEAGLPSTLPAAKHDLGTAPVPVAGQPGSDLVGDVLVWWRAGLALLGCVAAMAASAPAPGQFHLGSAANAEVVLNAEEQQTVNLFQKNTPGVVFITSQVYEISNAAQMEIMAVPKGSGSGWVYDKEGHIVTNFHVIQGANALTVKFIEGTQVPAKVVGADPYTDVAVLQVELPKSKKSALQPLVRGESAPLSVGQEVYAIGNPFGLDHTLTKGIVSGVGRTIMSVGGRPIQGAIQTDASINPGNSGGPLLNSQGQVVGMNTVIISPSGASAGVGFAIPSDTVSARVASILRYGYVKRPSLGLYLGQDGIARRLSGRDGGYVAGLQQVSAAEAAGVRSGDIITQIDERPVRRVNDIYAELDEHEPGQVVTVKLLRPELDPRFAEYEQAPPSYGELTLKVKLMEAAKET